MRESRRARWATLYFAGVMGAYALIILLAALPPAFVDYPDWVYQGVLLHGVLTGHPVAGYVLKHYPIPNSLTTLGIGVLDCVVPWQWAGKLWVCAYLALALVATRNLASALGVRDWRLFVVAPAVIFLNLNFWYGHIGFEVGLCLVMLLLAMLVREASPAAVAGMLVLIFFTHMEACAAALLLVLLWYGLRRAWRKVWTIAPAIALTFWYAAARFAFGNQDARGVPHADYHYGSPAFLVYKANTFFKTFGYVNARTMAGLSISERVFGKPLFVLLAAASLLMGGLCLYAIVRGAWKTGGSLRVFVFSLLTISLLLPQIWLGVADPGSRLLLMATAAGLFLVEWKRPVGTAIAVLSVVFCVANLWQFERVERGPAMQGHAWDLPGALLTYGHVEPALRLSFYDRLERGEMHGSIFETALFLDEER